MPQTSKVSYVRSELSRVLYSYSVIQDCIDGELAIKGILRNTDIIGGKLPAISYVSNQPSLGINMDVVRAQRYLPQPNPGDTSQENLARYKAYVERAVFYNVTSRTLDGMTGQVFQRDPVFELPTQLNPLLKDADGSGVGLTQLAMRAVRTVLPYGRGGLLVDYPPTAGATSKKQQEEGYIQPVIYLYTPWDIINWGTKKRGAKQVLNLVVLREWINSSNADDFEFTPECQYRVLRLDDSDVYFQEVYTETKNGRKTEYQKNDQKITVNDAAGKPLDYIPFSFMGSENNDISVDKPPLFDLASLNIAHYRNSADYEESAFVTGQPTLAISGLTEEWVKNVLKDKVEMGARAAVMLPINASAELLQCDPNTLPGDAMEKKERQMVALGAKLVQQSDVQRTATEAITETSAETSILANVATNVGKAFEWALGVAARFAGAATDKIKFELNRQFELSQMTPDDQSKIIAGWQKGAYTFGEMRAALRKAGIATLSDEQAQATITTEIAALMDQGLVADANPDPVPPAGGGPNPNPNTNPKAHALKKKTRGAGA